MKKEENVRTICNRCGAEDSEKTDDNGLSYCLECEEIEDFTYHETKRRLLD